MNVGDLVQFPDLGFGIILKLAVESFAWNECASVFFFNAQQIVSIRKFKLEVVSHV